MNINLIEKNFSKYAKFYDQYATVQKKVAKKLIHLLPPRLNPSKILELGCGTGLYTQLLQKKYPNAFIDAVDISAEMLKIAQKKIPIPNVNWLQADAETFQNKTKYALITSSSTCQWFKNIKNTFEQLNAQLSPNGKIIIAMFGSLTFWELKKTLSEYFDKEISLSSNYFLKKETLLKILQSQFQKVDYKEEIIPVILPTLKDLLTHIKYTGTRGEGMITAHENDKNKIFTKNQMEEIEKIYLKQFHQIIATYQTFFITLS